MQPPHTYEALQYPISRSCKKYEQNVKENVDTFRNVEMILFNIYVKITFDYHGLLNTKNGIGIFCLYRCILK